MKIKAKIATPAMSPTTIPTSVLVLKPVFEDALEVFDELPERVDSADFGIAAIAGGDVDGEETLGGTVADEGIKHRLCNGFPQSFEFPAK
ncbi:hypothetical protein Hanom_Chr06g00550351 [Helianthus anomalus]